MREPGYLQEVLDLHWFSNLWIDSNLPRLEYMSRIYHVHRHDELRHDTDLHGLPVMPRIRYVCGIVDLRHRHLWLNANLPTAQHVRRAADVCRCRVMLWNHDMRNHRANVCGVSHVFRFAVLHRNFDVCHQLHLFIHADVRGRRDLRWAIHVQWILNLPGISNLSGYGNMLHVCQLSGWDDVRRFPNMPGFLNLSRLPDMLRHSDVRRGRDVPRKTNLCRIAELCRHDHMRRNGDL